MKYKGMPKDSDIGPDESITQGAYAIDAACFRADQLNDIEGLLAGAAMWMKLSEMLTHYAPDDPEKLVGHDTNVVLGFQGVKPAPDVITTEQESFRK